MIEQFFDFLSDNAFGRIEITEPVKFDSSSFNLEKEPGNWGRDVRLQNEEVSFFIYRGVYDRTNNPLELPDGTVVYNLTMGFEYCIEYWKRYGFEAKINHVLIYQDEEFVTAQLFMIESDERDFIECKGVDSTKAAKWKRNQSTKVDVLSDKDIDGNPAIPLQTHSMLLKARPLEVESSWKISSAISQQLIFYGDDNFVVGPFDVPVKYDIQDSLFPFSRVNYVYPTNSSEIFTAYDSINLIKTVYEGSMVKVKVKNVVASFQDAGFFSYKEFGVLWGANYDDPDNYEYHDFFSTTDIGFFVDGEDYEFTIPFVPAGGFILVRLRVGTGATSHGTTPITTTQVYFNSDSLEIEATTTAIDSVCKFCFYNDVLRETSKRLSGQETVQPRWDDGGTFEKQAAINGYGLRQIVDKGFVVTPESLFTGLKEVAGGTQACPVVIYNGIYEDFFPMVEIGAFLQLPDSELKAFFRDSAKLNLFSYGYKTYEQDRDADSTLDSVHTETQWKLPNDQAVNEQPVNLDQVRDFNSFEQMRRQGIMTGSASTSLTTDDVTALMDLVPLPSNTVKTYSSAFLFQETTVPGELKILNTNLAGTNSMFGWGVIGLQVGESFTLLTGHNAGVYTITAIEPTILTLSGSPSFTGEEVVQFSYTISGVIWTNRTSEGFNIIEGIDNPQNCSNLRYHPRANMQYWEPFLATAAHYHQDRSILNSNYKSNGNIKTQFQGGAIYEGKAPIPYSQLRSPLLDPRDYRGKIVLTFTEAKAFFEAHNTIHADGTIGGFFRVNCLDGSVKRLFLDKGSWLYSQNILEFTGQAAYENEILEILTLDGNVIRINGASYPITILSDQVYEVNVNRARLLDSNARPLTNLYPYDKVSVNGTFYTSIELLSNALAAISSISE